MSNHCERLTPQPNSKLPPKHLPQTYVGDGAYVALEPSGTLRLYASDGIVATDNVFLGQSELHALVSFARRHGFNI